MDTATECMDLRSALAGDQMSGTSIRISKKAFMCTSPAQATRDDWDKQTHINLMAPMRLTRFLVPTMKEAGEGYIINIASIEALYPYPSVSQHDYY